MSDTPQGARPPAAWDNPAWVYALMLHPTEDVQLEYIREHGPDASTHLPAAFLWQEMEAKNKAAGLDGMTAKFPGFRTT
jgi:hypothetical protein